MDLGQVCNVYPHNTPHPSHTYPVTQNLIWPSPWHAKTHLWLPECHEKYIWFSDGFWSMLFQQLLERSCWASLAPWNNCGRWAVVAALVAVAVCRGSGRHGCQPMGPRDVAPGAFASSFLTFRPTTTGPVGVNYPQVEKALGFCWGCWAHVWLGASCSVPDYDPGQNLLPIYLVCHHPISPHRSAIRRLACWWHNPMVSLCQWSADFIGTGCCKSVIKCFATP